MQTAGAPPADAAATDDTSDDVLGLDAIVVTARNSAGRLILSDARIDGRRVDVIVDTGAQTSVGNPALTGWEPPSTLLSPANAEAMGYLQLVARAFVAIGREAGLAVNRGIVTDRWLATSAASPPAAANSRINFVSHLPFRLYFNGWANTAVPPASWIHCTAVASSTQLFGT